MIISEEYLCAEGKRLLDNFNDPKITIASHRIAYRAYCIEYINADSPVRDEIFEIVSEEYNKKLYENLLRGE